MNSGSTRIAALPRVVGLCGRSGAGKDVVATHLVERHGYRRLAVADHLKHVMALAFNMTDEQLWGAGRNEIDPRWGRTPREMYQQLGDALRAIHPDAVLNGWRNALTEAIGNGELIVVPDIRMPVELDVLHRLGGVVWRIVRPVPSLGGATAAHATETACDEMVVEAVIENSADIDSLFLHIDERLGSRFWDRRR